MHVVFRESRGLEETATPRDIGQDPADLVVLSYSDSDLAAFAAGWRRGRDTLPSLRLVNLAELRHPLSIDTYIERTLSQARGILVRLIGGESYWAYGLAALQQLARDRGIVLAVLPGRRPRRHAAGCVFDLAGLDAAAAQGALRHRRSCRGAGGDRAARAGLRSLCRAGYRRDERSRDGFLRPRAGRHCGAVGLRGEAARAGDVLSLLSHRRGHRPGRCPDCRAAREGI
ncbi:cobalamin biosynthesis Mg chelatase CobN [Bradyrhizobium sp. LM3.2]